MNTKEELKPLVAKTSEKPIAARLTMVNVIPNTDLRMTWGLIDVLRGFGVKVEEMDYGTCYVFVNAAGKYVKVVVGNRSSHPVIALYQMPKGQRFPLEACRDIARAFRYPKDVSANKALKEAMDAYYQKKKTLRRLSAANKA